MTIVNRLKTVVFDAGLDLPVFQGPYYKNGIIAGYRFAESGIFDITGNGNNLTQVGSPIISGGAAECTETNYYDTGLQLPTPEFTAIIVYKTELNASQSTFVCGDYETSNKGMLFFSRANNVSSVNLFTNNAGTNTTIYGVVNGPSVNGNFNFQSLKSSSANATSWSIQRDSYIQSRTFTGALSEPVGNILIGKTNTANNAGSVNTKRYIAEFLLYDKALTADELAIVYASSALYCESVGITGI